MTFYHPKYYKELRKLRNKSDQAISDEASTEATSVRPGPGLKQQAASREEREERGAKPQAASSKPCGARVKLQAASVKLLD
jgi:hypothetical protein